MDTGKMADGTQGTETEQEDGGANGTPSGGDGVLPGEGVHKTEADGGGSASQESPESPLKITPLALEKIKEISKEEGIDNCRLRVKVVGGGCAGFSYDLSFDEKTIDVGGEPQQAPVPASDPAQEGETKITIENVVVVIDEMSLMYIYGTEIDYVDTLQGTGFKFNNPNVSNTCGCGSSFQV